MHPRQLAKENSIFRHGKVNARCGEHALAEKPQSRNCDAQGNQGGAFCPCARRMTAEAAYSFRKALTPVCGRK